MGKQPFINLTDQVCEDPTQKINHILSCKSNSGEELHAFRNGAIGAWQVNNSWRGSIETACGYNVRGPTQLDNMSKQ